LRKRVLLLGAAVIALVGGLAAFSANTAEWVNVVAHVEKEITFACVDTDGNALLPTSDDADERVIDTGLGDCNYGIVFPETAPELTAELSLSQSYLAQDASNEVDFGLLWECKLPDPTQPWNDSEVEEYGAYYDYNGDGILELNICREDLFNEDNPLHLDGNIRDFVDVEANTADCLNGNSVEGTGIQLGGPAKVEGISRGFMRADENTKCVYTLTLNVPGCAGHVNPNTDPDPAAETIECQDNLYEDGELVTADPQQWEFWADLGDDLKVQVWGFDR
jgi:hypothetical protein